MASRVSPKLPASEANQPASPSAMQAVSIASAATAPAHPALSHSGLATGVVDPERDEAGPVGRVGRESRSVIVTSLGEQSGRWSDPRRASPLRVVQVTRDFDLPGVSPYRGGPGRRGGRGGTGMSREEMFDSFYQSTRRAVLHQSFALTGDLAAAQSAVKDAYVAAWHHWRKVATLEDREGWVRGRAFQLAQRRHAGRIWHRNKGISDEHKRVLDALSKVPSAQRRAVLLVLLAGLPVAAAAPELGVTRDVAERNLAAGAATLAEELGVDADAVRGTPPRARRCPRRRQPPARPDRATGRPQAPPVQHRRCLRRGDRSRHRCRSGGLRTRPPGRRGRRAAAAPAADDH